MVWWLTSGVAFRWVGLVYRRLPGAENAVGGSRRDSAGWWPRDKKTISGAKLFVKRINSPGIWFALLEI